MNPDLDELCWRFCAVLVVDPEVITYIDRESFASSRHPFYAATGTHAPSCQGLVSTTRSWDRYSSSRVFRLGWSLELLDQGII